MRKYPKCFGRPGILVLRLTATCLMLTVFSAKPEVARAELIATARAKYGALLSAEAIRQHIPPALADAVATIESGYDAQALGQSGEIGLMQLMPATAAMLGFRGTLAELALPDANVQLGVRYLAGAWMATGGRICDTLMKYRAGYGETVMSVRSIIYCRRARDYLASIGSPLATGSGSEIPPITPDMLAAGAAAPHAIVGRIPSFLTSVEITRMRFGRRTVEDSRRFWAMEEAYISRRLNRRPMRRFAARLWRGQAMSTALN